MTIINHTGRPANTLPARHACLVTQRSVISHSFCPYCFFSFVSAFQPFEGYEDIRAVNSLLVACTLHKETIAFSEKLVIIGTIV
jgi:hypothetical protein